MKSLLNSLIIAFSMYSKLPMPKTDWNKENMRYVMCFFPLVGLMIGGAVYLWSYFAEGIPMSRTFSTVIFILIPLLITGGIHMDGFIDTTDALSSYQPQDKKLEILKDPHTGAFALISCVGYYLLAFGIWYDVTPSAIIILAVGFILSRAFSGLSVVTFPLAKSSGLATMFSNEARRKVTRIVMIVYIFVCTTFILFINWKLGLICFISAFCVFIYYRKMSLKKFGGITGDLAGYFLQICELVMAIAVIIADKV
ncbi:MAG: cobalamin synthase [Herbinix sp.]|jgi:adenosylcobinamide-GDP ribazoletransferase|nr:cobalamin synthase [Herbinix sp.]